MAKIIVVDEDNKEVGTAEMSDAHKNGLIHRIVRIFLFNSKGELFLQQRSYKMSSSPGLWDQSAGGHVDEGETNLEAAVRESEEEIGLKNTELEEAGTYYAETDQSVSGQTLKRFNILYTATSDSPLILDPYEVESGRWVKLEELDQLILEKPEDFTTGLVGALKFYDRNLQ